MSKLYCTPDERHIEVELVLEGPRPAPRRSRRFGHEVEIEFHEDSPVRNGYPIPRSGNWGAYAPFPRDWGAKSDGSLSAEHAGVEIVSPVLHGPAGVAAVGYVYGQLEALDGWPSPRCGGHIHIERASRDGHARQDLLVALLEEGFVALTGGYDRWVRRSYAKPIKEDYDYGRLLAGGSSRRDRYSFVNQTNRETVEFRFPPATLSLPQFVLNLGMAQFVALYHRRYRRDRLVRRLESQAGWGLLDRVVAGLEFLREHAGWGPGGAWLGLPYDPASPPAYAVWVADGEDRRRFGRVELPGEAELLARVARQLPRFITRYYRRGGDGGPRQPRLDGAVAAECDRWVERALAAFDLQPPREGAAPFPLAAGEAGEGAARV